jgi:hypothetical protein
MSHPIKSIKHAGETGASLPLELGREALLKTVIMRYIDYGVRRRYRTLRRASECSGVDYSTLSRIRHQRTRRVSVAALLRIADQLEIGIKITIGLAAAAK